MLLQFMVPPPRENRRLPSALKPSVGVGCSRSVWSHLRPTPSERVENQSGIAMLPELMPPSRERRPPNVLKPWTRGTQVVAFGNTCGAAPDCAVHATGQTRQTAAAGIAPVKSMPRAPGWTKCAMFRVISVKGNRRCYMIICMYLVPGIQLGIWYHMAASVSLVRHMRIVLRTASTFREQLTC